MNKNYYAVIPANVRYDKDLTANAKLLYGEMTALSNEKGYCWATNSYFANLYNVKNETVSRWVSQLIKKGYIRSVIVYKDGTKEIDSRRLYIGNIPIDKNINTYCQESQNPIDKNINTPIDKKVKENTTIYNNTINNIYSANDAQDIWELYPNKKGKAQAMKKIPKLLATLGKDVLAECVKKYSAEVKGKDKQFILNGSTFFNGRYEDYLDDAIEAGSKANDNTDNNEVNENKYIFNLSEDM